MAAMGWGADFAQATTAARNQWLSARGESSRCAPVFWGQALPFATDCSGLESPLWALKELGAEVQHLWSSDVDKHARGFIRSNCALLADRSCFSCLTGVKWAHGRRQLFVSSTSLSLAEAKLDMLFVVELRLRAL